MPTLFDIRSSGFSVRAALPGDSMACRMLLPAIPAGAQAWVAVDGKHQLIVGAAALTPALRRSPLVGPGALMHVIAPCRNAGIGAALCDELLRCVAARGHQALYAGQRVEMESEEMHGWQRLGFAVCETVQEHELALDEIEPKLTPIIERFRSKGQIPAEARMIPLHEADRGRVLQLHLDHLGGDRGAMYRKLIGQGPGAYHPRYSRVLLLGERVVGCILGYRKSETVAVVEATILEPEVRNTWANVWLKLEAARGAMSQGVTHFQYTTFDHYGDTRGFTQRLGGATTRRWALMYRPL